MTKKKVTAPLTYNPGKGRPKEHLAYLNYQEMQALKRLNGNNQERGPRGLPSFPPADSRSGSYNSGYGSGGSKPSGSSKGPGGGMMGGSGSGGPSRTSPSSSGVSSRPSGGMMGGTGSGGSSRTSPSSGGGNKGNVGGMRSGPGGTGGYKTPSGGSGSGSRPSGGMRSGPGGTGGYKTPGAGGSNADRAAINAANKTNTLSAQKAPAFKADTGRTVNVGPMGTPVNVNAPPGGKIKGSIQGLKAAQTVSRGVTVPAATVQSPMATQGTSFASPLDARIENFQRINDARIRAGALGPEGVPSVSQIAAENASRLNAAKMAQQYSQYRSPPRGYPAAPQGVYGPRAGVGTGYLGTADMPGMITTGMTSSYSGAINPRFNAAQTLRAYEAEKRVPGKIQDRVPPTERFRPPARGIGDIPQSYPNTPPPGIPSGFKVEKSNIRRDRFGEPVLREKEVTDRLLQEPSYRPYDIRVTSPPAPIMGVSFDTGLKNKIQDRILPQSEYYGYGKFNAPSPSEKVLGVENIMSDAGVVKNIPGYTPSAPQNDLRRQGASTYTQSYDVPPTYPNYRPPSESSAFDPKRLAAYDSNFGPELSASVGSDIEKALIGDASPTYPNYGPPGGARGLGGYIPSKINGYEVYNPADYENSLALKTPRWEQSPAYSYNPDEEYSLENTAEGVPGAENSSEDFVDGTTNGETSPHPFQGMDEEQEANVDETLNRVKKAQQVGGPIVGVATGLPVNLITRPLTKKYMESVKERLNKYAAMTRDEKLAAEKRDPSLIGWGKVAGIPSVSDYSVYTSWAEKSGLRAPPSREGGRDSSGIASLGARPTGDETTTPRPDTPDTPSTTPGRRPDIYYMWDLGINIPSPSDPNYNQYQTYLAERLAAQRAMGYA